MNKKELYKQWKAEFYDKYAASDDCQDLYFESIAVGFFVAKGTTVEEAIDMYHYCVKQGNF